MDDQQWNWFMTPSTTPTTATFSPASVQTPRTNGHFQDAFSPYMHQQQYAPTPTQAHPDFSQFQPLQQDNIQTSFYDDSQSFQSSRPRQELQSSFSMSALSNTGKQGHNSFDFASSFQAQTPPPTRDASKRRSHRTQSVAFGTPTSIDARQDEPTLQPLGANLSLQPSPIKSRQQTLPMNNLQYMQTGPATAPIMSNQDQVFWDPSFQPQQHPQQQQQQQEPQWTPLDDPFTFNPHLQPGTQPVRAAATSHGRAQSFNAANPSMRPFPEQNAAFVGNNMLGGPIGAHHQRIPNMMTTGSGVNPNLLYTSPGRFMSNAPARPMGLQTSQSTNSLMMPLHSNRSEDNLSELRSMRSTAPSEVDENRPSSIRRSNTTATSRPTSMYGCVEPLSRSNSTANIPRRSSPLKRVIRNSLSSIAESVKPRPRTSVVLTVDSQGRARTETRVVDPSPNKALKTRYPTLWDDSDEESDSDTSTRTPSHNASFSASKNSERHSKVARLEPSLEGLEGLHLPRSNSSASMRTTPSKAAYAAAAQLRRQSSVKKPQVYASHNRRNTLQSLNSSFTDLPSMTSSTENLSHGDAGAALRHAMEGRSVQQDPPMPTRQSSRNKTARPTFPPRTTSLGRSASFVDSAPMVQPSPTKQAFPQQAQITFNNTADMSSITRCICGLNIPLTDPHQMVQCASCTMWLHTTCVGLHPQYLPRTYHCSYCTTPQNMHAVPTAGQLGWSTTAV